MSDRQWYENPSLVLQVHALAKLRDELREENLFEGEGIRPDTDLGEPTEEAKRAGWVRRVPVSAATRRRA